MPRSKSVSPPNHLVMMGDADLQLKRVMETVGRHLHIAIYRSGTPAGYSTGACVLSSHVIVDALTEIGLAAEVLPVWMQIRAYSSATIEDSSEVHRLEVGVPKKDGNPRDWAGHMVALVRYGPDQIWMIDSTLYQAMRPSWPGFPRMVAGPLSPDFDAYLPMTFESLPMASLGPMPFANGNTVLANWYSDPTNMSWTDAPDLQRPYRRLAARKLAIKLRGAVSAD